MAHCTTHQPQKKRLIQIKERILSRIFTSMAREEVPLPRLFFMLTNIFYHFILEISTTKMPPPPKLCPSSIHTVDAFYKTVKKDSFSNFVDILIIRIKLSKKIVIIYKDKSKSFNAVHILF